MEEAWYMTLFVFTGAVAGRAYGVVNSISAIDFSKSRPFLCYYA